MDKSNKEWMMSDWEKQITPLSGEMSPEEVKVKLQRVAIRYANIFKVHEVNFDEFEVKK